ncbi:GIY-YIG nuclease family protein [Kaarinaea lacus]
MKKSGSYVIVSEATAKFICKIGKLGVLEGDKGYYVYVGSALGSGGVRARVNHHLHITEKPHWHFDYLRPYVKPKRIWFCYSSHRYEHQWSAMLASLPGAITPMAKFGATDCRCDSHLYYFKKLPGMQVFRKRFNKPDAEIIGLQDETIEQWEGR